jgi:glycosyltransferase involved in cell wall biosynthesis
MNEKGHEGGCRNMGIDYPIDCEYYYFIDSDDYLYDNEVLKDVFKKINNNYPDVLFVRMMMYNEILNKSHLIS